MPISRFEQPRGRPECTLSAPAARRVARLARSENSRKRWGAAAWLGELRAHWQAARRLGLIAAALACGCGAEPRSVLLVTIDTLRADHVGAYGYAAARTPTLDRLAAAGVRFEQAVSPAPITLVSHASLLTGKIPPRHGVRDNGAYRLRDEHVTLPERLRQAGFATGAFVGAYVLDAAFGLAQGFDVYDDRMTGERSGSIGYAERSAAAVADAASAWIRELPPEQSFFAWIHFYDPHANYTPPPGFAAAFPGRPYDGEIAYADFHLGRVLEALASRPEHAETLVVVTSDHGESLGEHGEPTHTHFVYDATQRVPLILSGPGVPRGAVVASQVRLIDVAPTVLDLLRLPPLEGTQGVSLVPVMRSGAAPPADAYVETLAPRNMGWSPLVGLRSGGWKYIRAPRPELYELSEDPGERVNRISERSDEAARLRERLDAMLDEARRSHSTARVGSAWKRWATWRRAERAPTTRSPSTGSIRRTESSPPTSSTAPRGCSRRRASTKRSSS
jgi:arylsulfatase A-like enzyme